MINSLRSSMASIHYAQNTFLKLLCLEIWGIMKSSVQVNLTQHDFPVFNHFQYLVFPLIILMTVYLICHERKKKNVHVILAL